MRKLLAVLALFQPALASAQPFDPRAPLGVMVQTPITGTIQVPNQFQEVLPADPLRKSCLIPNYTQHVMYFYATPAGGNLVADGTTLNSMQVKPSGAFECVNRNGTVILNQIGIMTGTATDPYVAWFTH